MIRSIACLLLAGATSWPLMAQWGVRFTALHYETVQRRGNWNVMLGLDHDLNDRISIGLDFTRSINLFGEVEAEQTSYDGYLVDYSMDRKVTGLTYRSHYFFSDNDDGAAFYLGPFIGWRKVELDISPVAYNNYLGNDPTWARREVASSTLFPVGMRFGFRSALDGYSGDIHVSVGTQLGDKEIVGAPYLIKKDELSGLFLQFGYTIGIGW